MVFRVRSLSQMHTYVHVVNIYLSKTTLLQEVCAYVIKSTTVSQNTVKFQK